MEDRDDSRENMAGLAAERSGGADMVENGTEPQVESVEQVGRGERKRKIKIKIKKRVNFGTIG